MFFFLSDAVYVFLGASDSETEGSLVWNHSRELLNNTYTAWNPGQPEYHNDSDQFLQYSSGGWNVISSNLSKSNNNSFLCEQGASLECRVLIYKFLSRLFIGVRKFKENNNIAFLFN